MSYAFSGHIHILIYTQTHIARTIFLHLRLIMCIPSPSWASQIKSDKKEQITARVKRKTSVQGPRERLDKAWHLKETEKGGFSEIWPPILLADHLSTLPHWLRSSRSAFHPIYYFTSPHECFSSTRITCSFCETLFIMNTFILYFSSLLFNSSYSQNTTSFQKETRPWVNSIIIHWWRTSWEGYRGWKLKRCSYRWCNGHQVHISLLYCLSSCGTRSSRLFRSWLRLYTALNKFIRPPVITGKKQVTEKSDKN